MKDSFWICFWLWFIGFQLILIGGNLSDIARVLKALQP